MGFQTALSGLKAASNKLDVIGNNVANASTPGFKKSRAEFADVYAASSLGVSSSAIGSGVSMSGVTQQFTNGQVSTTGRNLDLAINNGSGFFVLSDGGERVYSRAGMFFADKDGNVVNSQGQVLQGYQADSLGNITASVGDIVISGTNLDPRATSTLNIQVSLDPNSAPPTSSFVTGFTPLSPPANGTYNYVASMEIYDSLGVSHNMNAYFVKAHAKNTWRVYVGVDGTDVTPAASALPASGDPYDADEIASPFTVVFDTDGSLIANSIATPTYYYGAGPVVSSSLGLLDTSALPTLGNGELILNGVSITPPLSSYDTFSVTGNNASSIAIAAAINASSNLHGVTATVPANTFTLTTGTYSTNALGAGDLTINGRDITGTASSAAALAALITAQSGTTGVTAAAAGNDIVLTAANGRNIRIQTDGTSTTVDFTNLSMVGGVALDKIARGDISLTTSNNEGLVIAGTDPSNIGFASGNLMGIVQSCSDIISIPTWSPGGGATAPQALSFDLTGSKQNSLPGVNTAIALSQNGYTTGQLASLNITSDGVLNALYTNSQSQQLAQIALAKFANPQALQPLGNTSWAETTQSGLALLGQPTTAGLGAIQSGALEDSNVDISEELVSLISAQRDFQANAQSIKTGDVITNTILNLR